MKYWQLITSIVLSVFVFLMPLSVQAASSSSVTRSILNAVGGEDFSGKNLIRAEFTSVTLKNANFTNADLRGAIFNGVLLDGANLHGSDFSSGIAYISRFKNVDLSDAILTDTNMLRSTFDNVEVTGADFTNALLDMQQLKKLCINASGTNSKTGVSTRESLGCP
ncbi:pentapeptide repeat-containing protein [Pseudanabaena sp. 'Roaring Creek']|uniref:pentapeptide repeat-containing protein n=1 Tax=Pseudanabaena sp. 'Roaring Creek' TaxID=1681830 RepID=UPI0006D82D3F|nr:pentapeptide repeat-containing protein [Pseudanabaena sp. 'Roaring Creek']